MKKSYKLILTGLLFFTSTFIFAQANLNVTFAAQYTYPGHTCANICGYFNPANNHEYALVGVSTGMDIVDVTIPTSPVHIVQIPLADNLWKEIKVYQNFAYVTTEAGGGLQIINLNALPATSASSYTYHNYIGDGAINGQLGNIHALHIDTTKGFCYLFGSNLFGGGAVILDLNADPYNPTYAGKYQNAAHNYVHDGYVDNDTLYAGHVYQGVFDVVNCTNKTSPVVLAEQTTTTAFTHNTWLTADRKHVLTTDENTNSYLTCYDVSNLSNIQETDRIQSQNPGSGSISHNTHVVGANWAVTSWYKDGFIITDITRPGNLINVGYYDTYPTGSGNGYGGDWGVYPFFPSGTIVVSNIDEGLFIFSPTYVRACYLEGNVTDACGTPLNNVVVNISTVNVTDQTNLSGAYATGTPIPGNYTVTFSKAGYQSVTYSNVAFTAGNVTNFNVLMSLNGMSPINGHAQNFNTSVAMQNVQVIYTNTNNTYNFFSDASGNFDSCSIVSDRYQIEAAAWGYRTICLSDTLHVGNSNPLFALAPGYEDDFTFDLGWTTTTSSSTGAWTRGVPVGTTYNTTNDANPGADASTDCLNKCYVTGNTGVTSTDDDVDGGSTTLTSPIIDLSTYFDPWVHYSRWFFNDDLISTNPNDSLIISLTNGTTTQVLETVVASSIGNSTWVPKDFRILNYFTPGPTMRLIVTTVDSSPEHIVEAGFDALSIADSSALVIQNTTETNEISVYPNPFNGATTVHYVLNSEPTDGAFVEVQDVAGRIVIKQAVVVKDGTVELGYDLSNGIYFVHIVNGNETSEVLRLVKTK